MTLEQQIQEDIKAAMKAHDAVAMAAVRAIKNEILLFKTSEGGAKDVTDAFNMVLLDHPERHVRTRPVHLLEYLFGRIVPVGVGEQAVDDPVSRHRVFAYWHGCLFCWRKGKDRLRTLCSPSPVDQTRRIFLFLYKNIKLHLK